MPLPPTVRVKLSSEAAGAISITPVVVQDLATRELIEHVLAVTGKDPARIREILRRGALVSGASRFRWTGWDPEAGALDHLLATFPDPDPALPFDPGCCLRAVLHGGRQPIDLPREAASRHGLLDRGAFWDLLMQVTTAGGLRYAGYSYRDRADRYLREFTALEAERLRAGAAALTYSTLRDQIQSAPWTRAELYAVRHTQAQEEGIA